MAAPVVDAVLRETQVPDVREAMLLGSHLEGGWGPSYGVGDQGTSFGPYQIHLPAHPGVTRAQAEDPVWASDYMYGNYVRGVTSVQPVTLWVSDPEAAAEQAAYRAEAPTKIYHESRGWPVVDQAWADTVAALRAAGQPLGEGGAGSGPHGGGTVTPSSNAGDGGGGGQYSAACQAILDQALKDGVTVELLAKWDIQGCPGNLGQALQGATGLPGAGHGGPIAQGVAGAVGDVAGAFGSVLDALKFLFSIRFLEIMGGGLLILVGLYLLSKSVAGGSVSPASG